MIGHSLQHDFKSLAFEINEKKLEKVRDVGKYAKYKSAQGQAKSLKKLASEFLGRSIQDG